MVWTYFILIYFNEIGYKFYNLCSPLPIIMDKQSFRMQIKSHIYKDQCFYKQYSRFSVSKLDICIYKLVIKIENIFNENVKRGKQVLILIHSHKIHHISIAKYATALTINVFILLMQKHNWKAHLWSQHTMYFVQEENNKICMSSN